MRRVHTPLSSCALVPSPCVEKGGGNRASSPCSITGAQRGWWGWHTRQTFFCMAEAGSPQTPEVAANPKNRQQALLALKVTVHCLTRRSQWLRGLGSRGLKGLAYSHVLRVPRIRQAPAGSGPSASARVDPAPKQSRTLQHCDSLSSAVTNWLHQE